MQTAETAPMFQSKTKLLVLNDVNCGKMHGQMIHQGDQDRDQTKPLLPWFQRACDALILLTLAATLILQTTLMGNSIVLNG